MENKNELSKDSSFLNYLEIFELDPGLVEEKIIELKKKLGNDFNYVYFAQSNTTYATPFTVYSIYKNYYVKEIDGVLEYSTTQEDDTWILVSDYVAAKNCTLA